MVANRLIIIGGGFAGVKCARTLRKALNASELEIVLFSRENHMVFYPMLAEVAAAAISPKDMAAPLRQLVKEVQCRTEEVLDIDLDRSEIVYGDPDGDRNRMKYDHIVIANGNTTNLASIPGMVDHAFSLKSISDAINIQAHVIGQLEKAEIATSEEKKKCYLTFVVVGGGFSGVELAGELNDFLKSSSRFYSNFSKEDIDVILVHGHEQILPEVSESLREFARQKMQQNGVRFILNAQAGVCTREGVGLKDGRFLTAGTVICTIGTRALPMIERLNVPKKKNRLAVEPDMSLPGYGNAWAIGDCAAVVNAADEGKLSPTTGQFAERQGEQVAKNIIACLSKQPTRPFFHRSLGTLCSIGGRSAVAEMFDIRISGFLAWFVWRSVYLLKLPSLFQQIKVAAGWTFDLISPPQLTSVPIDVSRRLGNAHYAAGDFIFEAGDPATDFYAVDQGQVEILSTIDGEEEVVAIFGSGDFFGENALMTKAPHRHSCRARTDCEIMVMGRNIFNQISKNLTPFKTALASAVKRRSLLFQNLPETARYAQNLPLRELIEPVSCPLLTEETSLLDVVSVINKNRLDYVYIVDEQQQLIGLVTRSDLMRWGEVIAAQSERKELDLTVKDLLIPLPISVTNTAETKFAITLMREHGFKRLPVIDSQTKAVVGVLRMENIMERMLRQVVNA